MVTETLPLSGGYSYEVENGLFTVLKDGKPVADSEITELASSEVWLGAARELRDLRNDVAYLRRELSETRIALTGAQNALAELEPATKGAVSQVDVNVAAQRFYEATPESPKKTGMSKPETVVALKAALKSLGVGVKA